MGYTFNKDDLSDEWVNRINLFFAMFKEGLTHTEEEKEELKKSIYKDNPLFALYMESEEEKKEREEEFKDLSSLVWSDEKAREMINKYWAGKAVDKPVDKDGDNIRKAAEELDRCADEAFEEDIHLRLRIIKLLLTNQSMKTINETIIDAGKVYSFVMNEETETK